MRFTVFALLGMLIQFSFAHEGFASVRLSCAKGGGGGTVLGVFEETAKCPDCFDRGKIFRAAMDAQNPETVGKKCGNLYIEAKLYGYIDYDDFVIVSTLKLLNGHGFLSHVIIESDGGLIEPAMSIGDFLFENRIEARVQGRCYSACGIVAAGAVRRYYDADYQIGIHRVSADDIPSPSSPTALEEYFAASYEKLRRYFSKYGVSPALVDAIQNIPAAKIRTLTLAELVNFGLGVDNVAFRDLAQYRISRACGKNTSESYNEAANMLSTCFDTPNFQSMSICRVDTLAETSVFLKDTEKRCF